MPKSGLEMIEELLNKVSLLDRRFAVIEQNMKELLNRANGFKVQESVAPKITGSSPSAISAEGLNASAVKSATKKIKTLGIVKNKDKKGLRGVDISIVNENGDVIKKTRTNMAGEWLSWLPPGKYKARYFMENMINATVPFTITPDQTLIRVAQPKWE